MMLALARNETQSHVISARSGQTLRELAHRVGYYAGYYDKDTRVRVEKLFKCNHPIFGSAKDGTPTQEEAFNAWLEAGRENKEESWEQEG